LGVTAGLSSGVAAAAVGHRDDFHPRPSRLEGNPGWI
jgi:hypothetical protein